MGGDAKAFRNHPREGGVQGRRQSRDLAHVAEKRVHNHVVQPQGVGPAETKYFVKGSAHRCSALTAGPIKMPKYLALAVTAMLCQGGLVSQSLRLTLKRLGFRTMGIRADLLVLSRRCAASSTSMKMAVRGQRPSTCC